MIQEFVEIWDRKKHLLEEQFREEGPASYSAIVEAVVRMLHDDGDSYDKPNPDKIHVIDDGDYQGTQLFIIPADTYQPSTYWRVFVDYGSCSGCDTLEAIREYSEDKPTDKQVKDYMMLALHILQNIKEL